MTETFHYFGLYTRGEAIRMVLTHAGANWTDNRVAQADWPALKSSMPGGQMPCLELADGTKLGQSMAILRFLGHRHGYYPQDAMEIYHVENILSLYDELIGTIYMPVIHSWYGKGEDVIAEATDKIFTQSLPKFLEGVSSYVSGDGWAVGGKMTIADFIIGHIWVSFINSSSVGYGVDRFAEVRANNPHYAAYGARFEAEMAAYLGSRPACPI